MFADVLGFIGGKGKGFGALYLAFRNFPIINVQSASAALANTSTIVLEIKCHGRLARRPALEMDSIEIRVAGCWVAEIITWTRPAGQGAM